MAPAKTALFDGARQALRQPLRRGPAGNPGFPRVYETWWKYRRAACPTLCVDHML